MNLSLIKLSEALGNPNYQIVANAGFMNEREFEARNKKLQNSLQSTEKIQRAIAKAVAL